jgi:hypothetical protein
MYYVRPWGKIAAAAAIAAMRKVEELVEELNGEITTGARN